MSKINVTSPKGELKWIFISGQGRKNLNGEMEYTASVQIPKDEAAALVQKLEEFWDENKPRGATKPKSMGFKETEDGQHIQFTFKTKPTYPNGEPKLVRVFNAKADEVKLPENQRIGNGSRGRIAGVAAIYDAGKAAQGVTLYLDSVQLTKFVAYSPAAGFDADEDEDAFTGFAESSPFSEDDLM